MLSQLTNRFWTNPSVKNSALRDSFKVRSGFIFKKPFLLLSFIVLLTAGSNISQAGTGYWYNYTGNDHWTTPNNWYYYDPALGVSYKVPGLPFDDAVIMQPGDWLLYNYGNGRGPIFSANDGTQSVFFIVVGLDKWDGGMTMNGGTLKVPWGFTFNKFGYTTTNSTMNMSGGLLHLGPWPGYVGTSSGFLGIGRAGTGTFNMTGGTIECVGFSIPESGTGTIGTFNLDGGIVNAESLWIAVHGAGGETKTGRLNITKGKLILTGDATVTVNGYVGSGVIVPYLNRTGRCVVNVDYDNYTPAKTTVTASLTTLTQAWKPQPMDTNPNVDQFSVLSWSPGDGAISHNVYLGVNSSDVDNGIVEPVAVDTSSYDPGGLAPGQTYYWRVDEFDGATTYKGVVWSFTVAYNPLAANPHPGDGVKGVDPSADLIWTAGDKATAHDVYLGTSYSDVSSASNPNVLPGRGRQTATSYDPGTLILGQKYYWRVDEFDGSIVHKGTVWSFEVASSFAANPSPLDGGRYVARDVVLGWSAGYGAISHDVYIGTNSSDINNGTTPVATTSQTAYDPEGLQLGRTYYWRIDEFDGASKYKGAVWSFTTEPIGSVRAFPGAEGYGAYSTGGRGGDVYHVTNLTDNVSNPQPGSLRYGISTTTGHRTIVFDVSGYIELQDRLEISKPYLTIVGQTAPGLGITIRKNDVRIYNTNNLIVRYLRVRPGYYSSGQDIAPHGYLDLDALSIEGGQNIILDHISTSWSRDECMSVGGDSNDVTVQWCTMTEPLNYDEHSKTSLLRLAKTGRLTHHHNLYADVMQRVTRFGNWNDNVLSRYNWYNNVVFNWGAQSTYSSDNTSLWNYVSRGGGSAGTDGEFVELNFMDNYFIAGPATSWNKAYQGGSIDHDKIWAAGNVIDLDVNADVNGVDTGWDMLGGNYTKMPAAFSIESPYTRESSQTAYQQVLAKSGNSYIRDDVDKRVIGEIKECRGIIPITQNDVGGWPAIPEIHRPAGFDTDGDGMPDAWEIARELNPNDGSDGAIVSGDDGYTNLEKYLNYLASRGGVPGDFDNNSKIDLNDLATLCSHWLDNDCGNVPAGNLDYDCDVDLADYAIFAGHWLEGVNP